MTARNRAELLRNTLESIARQGFPNSEIIVVEDGWDGGATEAICDVVGQHAKPKLDIRYFCRKNRPPVEYSNPAVPVNIGLRKARGRVILLQNAECLHASEKVIERLAAPVLKNPRFVTFASVSARHQNGAHWHWYVHPTLDCGMRPFFFCGAIAREHIERLRGMDEDYKFYGWEDNDFADRMAALGLVFDFHPEVVVHHQWHLGTNCFGIESSVKLYSEKKAQMLAGTIGPERNLGREWGSLDS